MKEAYDKKLVKAFSNLYTDRYETDMRKTSMLWGFECNSGWFPLIWDLSKKLEAEILKQPKEKQKWYKATQVKEKYGSLRVYLMSGTKEMYDLIDEAEALSLKTCEDCGMPGEQNDKGWIKTSCKKHRNTVGGFGMGGVEIDLDWRIKIKYWLKNLF